ncbi:MAG: redox-regulated ATPase YchF [Thermodesulfovibrionales bacterium]|nr:redox-regulated ATPase YchF [Thermodesulfovibrionales bacterium]
MKLPITGLANSGKTTIFNALTGLGLPTSLYITREMEPHIATVKVPDRRLETLASIFKPARVIPATVEYIDYIGLTRGDVAHNRKVFDLVRDSDSIVHVVRAFENEAVIHPLGNTDPLRDLEAVEFEFIFGDLELVMKRLQRIEEAKKKGKKPSEEEIKVLLKCRDALESEKPLRFVQFSEEEQKILRPVQFLSDKPEVVVFNTDEYMNSRDRESLIEGAEKYFQKFSSTFKEKVRIIALSGKIEMELSQMTPEEQMEFLSGLGIDEPALNKLIRISYGLLNYISFFTVGEDEVRAWTIKDGTSAQKAAGKIHSDMERGFIRAEVVSFDDFIKEGSLAILREKGLLRLEGKDYIVRDGDIINFRFHV